MRWEETSYLYDKEEGDLLASRSGETLLLQTMSQYHSYYYSTTSSRGSLLSPTSLFIFLQVKKPSNRSDDPRYTQESR